MNDNISSGQIPLLKTTWKELMERTGERSKTAALVVVIKEYLEKRRCLEKHREELKK